MHLYGADFAGSNGAQAALGALVSALQQRHAQDVEAVLFYGSCLRSGDLHDGLVDLYVIVGSYRRAHRNIASALANRLLAPNVYYLQVESGGRAVRCKYAVLTLRDLERRVSRASFESYFWGRFSQPVALVHEASPEHALRVRASLRRAVITTLERALPCAAERGTLRELWERALALSYGTELRAEGGKRPGALIDSAPGYYHAVSIDVAPDLRAPLAIEGETYHVSVGAGARRAARIAWALRRVHGKTLSVLRLLKALFTFEGGFDYIAWKLERHSGRPVEIPARVRRYPLIFVWGLMWKLYREGVFR